MAATALLALLLASPPLPLAGPPPPPPAPPPPPPARAVPTGPQPPTEWPFRRFSADDYPASAMRGQEQGFVAYRLEIGPDGRASNCEIRQSSGSASLDAATCRIVASRSRFTPARDSEGRHVPDYRDGWVTWRLGIEEGQGQD